MVVVLEVDNASSDDARSPAQERADALLQSGKISLEQYKALLKADANFRVEEAKFERDEVVLAYQKFVEETEKSDLIEDERMSTDIKQDDEKKSVTQENSTSGCVSQIRDVSRIDYVDIDESTDNESDCLSTPDPPKQNRAVLPEHLPVSKVIGSANHFERSSNPNKSISPKANPQENECPSPLRQSSGLPGVSNITDGNARQRKGSGRFLRNLFHRSSSQQGRSFNTGGEEISGKNKSASSEDHSENEGRTHQQQVSFEPIQQQQQQQQIRRHRRHRRTERMSEQPFSPSDFERLRRTAKGGFGTVYLVRKRIPPGIGEIFAMVLHKSTILNHGDAAKAKLERDVLRYIKHPFVARLRYAFQTETRLYLVTDFYVGGTLTSMLKKTTGSRRCTPHAATFYAAELASALHHLHQKGIVHFDIKPSNILVDRDGHVILIDFGIAGIIQPKKKQLVDQFIGTYVYMAPEMISKNTVHGPFCDWWALGVVIYELLFGVTPFDGGGMRGAFEKILRYQVIIPPPPPPPLEITNEEVCPASPPLDNSHRMESIHSVEHVNYQENLDKYKKTALDDLVLGLLIKDYNKRLSDAQVISHPAFISIDFEDLQRLGIRPPHRPKLANYLSFDTNDGRLLCNEISDDLPSLDDDGESIPDQNQEPNGLTSPKKAAPQQLFRGFSYAGDPIDSIAPIDPSIYPPGTAGICKSHQIAAFGPSARAEKQKSRRNLNPFNSKQTTK